MQCTSMASWSFASCLVLSSSKAVAKICYSKETYSRVTYTQLYVYSHFIQLIHINIHIVLKTEHIIKRA